MYKGVCRSSDGPKLSWDSGTIDSCDSSDVAGVEVRVGRSLFDVLLRHLITFFGKFDSFSSENRCMS